MWHGGEGAVSREPVRPHVARGPRRADQVPRIIVKDNRTQRHEGQNHTITDPVRGNGLGDGSGRETPPRGPVQRGGQIHRKRRDPDGRQERIQLRDARGRFHAQALRAAPDGRQVQLVRRRAARAGRSGQRSEQRLRDSLRHSGHFGPGVQQADVQPDAERGQERRRAAAAGVGRRESEGSDPLPRRQVQDAVQPGLSGHAGRNAFPRAAHLADLVGLHGPQPELDPADDRHGIRSGRDDARPAGRQMGI